MSQRVAMLLSPSLAFRLATMNPLLSYVNELSLTGVGSKTFAKLITHTVPV